MQTPVVEMPGHRRSGDVVRKELLIRVPFLGIFRAFLLLSLLTGAFVACGDDDSPLAVSGITFKHADASGNAGDTVTSFAPSDRKLFAVAALNHSVSNFSGKVVWTAVSTSAGQNVIVGTVPISGVSGNALNANVELPRDWPTGSYKVDFYQGDTLLKSQDFKIQ